MAIWVIALGMPVMLEQLLRKPLPHRRVFALHRQQHALGDQIHKHRQVVVPLLAVHLIGPHPDHVLPA